MLSLLNFIIGWLKSSLSLSFILFPLPLLTFLHLIPDKHENELNMYLFAFMYSTRMGNIYAHVFLT